MYRSCPEKPIIIFTKEAKANDAGLNNISVIVQPKKVIQVNKPQKYYEDRSKTREFIYKIAMYWEINEKAFTY